MTPRPNRSPASPSSYQKRVDYAFRAVHMTAVEAKRIAAAYYGRAPPIPTGTAARPAAARA